jgi:hypothetical protein
VRVHIAVSSVEEDASQQARWKIISGYIQGSSPSVVQYLAAIKLLNKEVSSILTCETNIRSIPKP